MTKTRQVRIGDIVTVDVDGTFFTGKVYHVRENGWPCVEGSRCFSGCEWCATVCPGGHVASGPLAAP